MRAVVKMVVVITLLLLAVIIGLENMAGQG